jgi:uncharacterized repeat protein (TIGR04076 family)
MKELKVMVKKIKDHCGANLKVGDSFYVKGKGKVQIPDNQEMCIYALGSLIPFLTTKQMEDSLPKDDWVPETSELSCPDPGGVVFEIRSL